MHIYNYNVLFLLIDIKIIGHYLWIINMTFVALITPFVIESPDDLEMIIEWQIVNLY